MAEGIDIVRFASAWAAEVVQRYATEEGRREAGVLLKELARHRSSDELRSDLTVLLYIVVEESRRTRTIDPWGPTEVADCSPETDIGFGVKWTMRDTQAIATSAQREDVDPEEIAENFDLCCARLKPGCCYAGLFTREQQEALLRLDAWLDSFSGQENAEYWTDEALMSSPQWEEARRLARVALGLLGVGDPEQSGLDG